MTRNRPFGSRQVSPPSRHRGSGATSARPRPFFVDSFGIVQSGALACAVPVGAFPAKSPRDAIAAVPGKSSAVPKTGRLRKSTKRPMPMDERPPAHDRWTPIHNLVFGRVFACERRGERSRQNPPQTRTPSRLTCQSFEPAVSGNPTVRPTNPAASK